MPRSPFGQTGTVLALEAENAYRKNIGIQLACQNHNFEFEPKDGGKCGYDVFTEEFSPEMKFEIDVFWVKAAGVVNCHVEQDQSPDPLASIRQSMDCLRKL